MPRYKPYNANQSRLVPIILSEHIYEGSLEETIHLIVEEQIDLSGLDNLYKNDETGRPAIHPKVLLKVILLAYARGITGSRRIERACRENVLLQALITHLLLNRDEVIIVDMEAGIEHLGRATAKAVDKLIVVVEPGRRSVETTYRIHKLAEDIGLHNIAVVGNKVRRQSDKEFLISALPSFEFLGFIPYDQAIIDADLANHSLLDSSQQIAHEVENIYQALLSRAQISSVTS